jgi:hypothetical protein
VRCARSIGTGGPRGRLRRADGVRPQVRVAMPAVRRPARSLPLAAVPWLLGIRGRCPTPRGSRLRAGSRWGAMEQLAPAPVVLAACLSTSPRQRVGRHEQVVGASPGRSMGWAPTKLDEVTRGVGVGLTARTVGANDCGGTWLDEVRHVSIPSTARSECFILWQPSTSDTRCRVKNAEAGAGEAPRRAGSRLRSPVRCSSSGRSAISIDRCRREHRYGGERIHGGTPLASGPLPLRPRRCFRALSWSPSNDPRAAERRGFVVASGAGRSPLRRRRSTRRSLR